MKNLLQDIDAAFEDLERRRKEVENGKASPSAGLAPEIVTLTEHRKPLLVRHVGHSRVNAHRR